MKKKNNAPVTASAIGNNEIKAPAQSLGTITLKLSDIVVDADKNQRHAGDPDADEAFQSLCASIREEGLLQPPGIQIRRGKNHLVFGFRRYAALLAIYGANHEQVFAVIPGGEREARLANYIENASRLDLAPYEHCLVLSAMKGDGYSTKEISDKIGKSVSHVENLIRIKAKLCPALWEEFVKRGRSAMIAKFLKAAGKSSEAEQLAAFNGPAAETAAVPSTEPATVETTKPQSTTEPVRTEAPTVPDGATIPADAAPAEPPIGMKVDYMMNLAMDQIGSATQALCIESPEPTIHPESYLSGIVDACRWLTGQLENCPIKDPED